MRTLFICLLATACSLYADDPDHGDPPIVDPPIDFPSECPKTACATGPTITSDSELVAIIDALSPWTYFGEYTTGCLPASNDITVTGSMTVQASALAVPPECANGCEQPVKFMLRGAPSGIACINPESFWDFATCEAITVVDSTFRLRKVQRDIHPAPGNFIPLVEVMSACESTCDATEFACAATHTCWPSARDLCAYCFGGENDQCACFDGTDFMADGSRCHMMVSGDVQVAGTCKAGVCETEL